MSEQMHNLVISELRRQGERLDAYNSTLDRLTVTVEEHVKRTNLLEAQVKPIKAHVDFVNTLAKFIASAAVLAVALKNLHFF